MSYLEKLIAASCDDVQADLLTDNPELASEIAPDFVHKIFRDVLSQMRLRLPDSTMLTAVSILLEATHED